MVIDIIRVQGGENLTQVLNSPATEQQVRLHFIYFYMCFSITDFDQILWTCNNGVDLKRTKYICLHILILPIAQWF